MRTLLQRGSGSLKFSHLRAKPNIDPFAILLVKGGDSMTTNIVAITPNDGVLVRFNNETQQKELLQFVRIDSLHNWFHWRTLPIPK